MYIVLEGIDGVGKSSQAELLNEHYKKQGYDTKLVDEPTNSEIGKLIRKELLNPESTNDINQEILALLFAADRLTLKKEILETKGSKEKLLISGRSFYSSLCYQNNSSVEQKWIYKINENMPRPDLTILLDLNEKESIKRCDGEEIFENIEFLKKTRENYLKLTESEENIEIIDANQDIDKVFENIKQALSEKLEI